MTKEQFIALPKAQKRVVIAKDIIKQLKASKYIANTGNYIGDLMEGDIKANFKKITDCQVCMMGATLLSCTKIVNNLTDDDIYNSGIYGSVGSKVANGKIRKILSLAFTPAQLSLIEDCFEGSAGEDYLRVSRTIFGEAGSSKNKQIAWDYMNEIDDDGKRMISICKNIIRNKGEFKPKQDLKL